MNASLVPGLQFVKSPGSVEGFLINFNHQLRKTGA